MLKRLQELHKLANDIWPEDKFTFKLLCGGDHAKVLFKKFTRDNPQYSHWGMCPNLGEPILMKIIETKDENDK
jgi:hypothetical protein